jgi:hypothetical protein
MRRFLSLTMGVGVIAVLAYGAIRASQQLESLPSLAGGCGEAAQIASQSPDGKYTAVLFERDCGATTDHVQHVNLRDSSIEFVADEHAVINSGLVFLREGRDRVDLLWQGPRHLVIRGPATQVFEQKASWRDVRVSYEVRPSPRGKVSEGVVGSCDGILIPVKSGSPPSWPPWASAGGLSAGRWLVVAEATKTNESEEVTEQLCEPELRTAFPRLVASGRNSARSSSTSQPRTTAFGTRSQQPAHRPSPDYASPAWSLRRLRESLRCPRAYCC